MYIYEQPNWPNFYWDEARIMNTLAEVKFLQGKLVGKMQGVGFNLQVEASLLNLTQDVIKTSEIEGEKLEYDQVRSSIARRLGIDIGINKPVDRNVEGIVEVMLDAIINYNKPLSTERLFDWHSALFPTGRSGMFRINVGKWREEKSGPMQVVSGPVGREKVHYEAPSSDRLEREMDAFLDWFNNNTTIDLVIKSAIAHFWFVSIHPFEDGNGRIARTIADMLLARSEKSQQRFYSMSAQIKLERKEYYEILEISQKSDLDITPWLNWFLNCLKNAILQSDNIMESILNKANFWRNNSNKPFNDRQRKILNMMLDGFEGKLTSSKWSKICHCSQDTALRDIQGLLIANILKKELSGGRNTSYALVS
jgi:Fic family protein